MQTTELTRRDAIAAHPVEFSLCFVPPIEVVHVYWSVPEFTRYYEEVTPDEPGSRSQWKSFEHYKLVTTPAESFGGALKVASSSVHLNGAPAWGLVPDANGSLSSIQFGSGGIPIYGLPALYDKRLDGGFVPPPDGLDALIDASYRSMLPLIKPELSLINSVIELKDFASLPRTLKTLSSLPDIATGVRQRLTLAYRSWKKSLKEWNRATADSYLQAKFNILPLLSDISGLKTALTRTERRLNDFITRAGRVQKRHYARFLTEFPPRDVSETAWQQVSPLYNDGLQFATTFKDERSVSSEATTFHAEIQYNYNYAGYQLEHARLLSLLDAVGINFNPAIIWNAIPWSFVVDWVFGVSHWLNKQRIGLMDPQINIHRYLWSVKRRRNIIILRRTSCLADVNTSAVDTTPWMPLTATTEQAYRRTAGLPLASSIISSGLNASEFSLGAALVIAQRRRPTRRKSWAFNYEFPG